MNYNKISVGEGARIVLHDQLNLTGAEISINTMPAGTSVPIIHAHKQNEEIYAILEGKGSVVIDGETVELRAGDWVRISPPAKRQFFASAYEDLKYICIQVKENSLGSYGRDDGILYGFGS